MLRKCAQVQRTRREAAAGKQSGRTQEIQRLIGRALRAGVDRQALGQVAIALVGDDADRPGFGNGKVAAADGTSKWITNEASRGDVQVLREADRLEAELRVRACLFSFI